MRALALIGFLAVSVLLLGLAAGQTEPAVQISYEVGGDAGLDVFFSATIGSDPDSEFNAADFAIEWNFGDETNTTLPNRLDVSHGYATGGLYNVSATVFSGTFVATGNITLNLTAIQVEDDTARISARLGLLQFGIAIGAVSSFVRFVTTESLGSARKALWLLLTIVILGVSTLLLRGVWIDVLRILGA